MQCAPLDVTPQETRSGFRVPLDGLQSVHDTGSTPRAHDFRRTGVRGLELARVPRGVAKRMVGHRTDSMYERYAIRTEDDPRAAVRQLHEHRMAGSVTE